MNKYNVPLEHKVSVSEAMEETNKLELQPIDRVLVFIQPQTFTDFMYQFSLDVILPKALLYSNCLTVN